MCLPQSELYNTEAETASWWTVFSGRLSMDKGFDMEEVHSFHHAYILI